MSRACSTLLAPIPMEPSPPAFDTAAASLGVETPTMGDWMMGSSMFNRDNSGLDIKHTLEKNRERGVRPPGTTDGVQARAYTPSHPKNVNPYLEVGMANSAPLAILSGQRCMIDFCLV